MFETVKRLYNSGKLTTAGVQRAVEKGWITEAQARDILSKG